MCSAQIPATPVSPVAPYLGGKRNLASRIIERIAKVPHDTYVEPFIGMGGVFLRRPFRARGEVINDVSRDVSNLFRILQRHYVPLMDMLRFQLTSRADFQRLLETNAASLTDLERAARFTLTAAEKTLVKSASQGVFNEIASLETSIAGGSSITATAVSALEADFASFETCWTGVKAGQQPPACAGIASTATTTTATTTTTTTTTAGN